jgi:hypothetical protein
MRRRTWGGGWGRDDGGGGAQTEEMQVGGELQDAARRGGTDLRCLLVGTQDAGGISAGDGGRRT